MVWLAKGINDAKKYQQKITTLKKQQRRESFFLGCFVRFVLVVLVQVER